MAKKRRVVKKNAAVKKRVSRVKTARGKSVKQKLSGMGLRLPHGYEVVKIAPKKRKKAVKKRRK